MRRYLGVVLCLILIGLLRLPTVQAQDCNSYQLASQLHDFAYRIGDKESLSRLLDEVETWSAKVRTACVQQLDTGLQARPELSNLYTFTSDEYGSDALLDFMYLPDGLYKVRLETNGAISGKLEQSAGSCIVLSLYDLFSIYELNTQNTVERVLYVDNGCEARIHIEKATGSWKIVVSGYGDTSLTPLEDTYSSEVNGTMPVFGPILFEDGTYEFTLTTAGFMVLSVQTLSGDCQTEAEGFLISVRTDEAKKGVKSTLTTQNCLAFITTDNALRPGV